MEKKIFVRMGDGERVRMETAAVKADILAGTADAAEWGGVSELTAEDQEKLLSILAEPGRMVSVEPGEEVVVTDDGASMSFYSGQDGGGVGTPMSRAQAVLTYERACGADTTSLGNSDYSYKPVKPIINSEANDYYNISMNTTAPFLYGAQPNMGLYYQPDGPCPNATELMPMGKIKEALQAQEEASALLEEDLVYVGRKLADVGLEGINFDTCGSAGDADYLAALKAVRRLKKSIPDLPVIMGSSGEFILGMHGSVTFDDTRLAGLYPQDQVKLVADAGASIYGMAVNTATTKSLPWNLAKAVTFMKATTDVATIPVHANVGMGVCGIPMLEEPPIDAVTRVSKSLVQIGKADGLQIGVGDPMGMHIPHILASCMGGIRTAGDLVAWMQLTRKMKIDEAKSDVAEKLGVDRLDLTDEDIMREVRQDLELGTVTSIAGSPKGIRAKHNAARVLDIDIRSVNLFKSQWDK